MRPKLVQFITVCRTTKKDGVIFLKLGELIGFGEPEKVEFSKKTVFLLLLVCWYIIVHISVADDAYF